MKKLFLLASLFICSFGSGDLQAAPSFTEVCNTLYINWYDNPIRTHDFHDEILHSIEKNDSLFMNQLIEHKTAKDQKMIISAAHIRAAVVRNRYDILNNEDAAFAPGALHDDAPVLQAIDAIRSERDIKSAQEASFFVGKVLQQKKSYSAPLLQKISEAFSSENDFRCAVRHLHNVQMNLEACVRDNQVNEESQERTCLVTMRYAALNPSMLKNMFSNSVTPALHAVFLKHCKKELKDEVPHMSYEDKKSYVDGNYSELLKIMSDDEQDELFADAIREPLCLKDDAVKKKVLQYVQNAHNMQAILKKFADRQFVSDLCRDANLIAVIEGVSLLPEGRIALEDAITQALNAQQYLDADDYEYIGKLCRLCPSLPGEAQKIEPLLEEIRKKYEILKDAWTFHTMSESYLLAPLNKGTIEVVAGWHSVYHIPFLDGMLGYIACGLTKSNIADIPQENPFVKKAFGDSYRIRTRPSDSHLDQKSIRAACTQPLVLKEALRYLDTLIERYQTQNDKADKCSICFDSYSGLPYNGKIPKGGSDAPRPDGKAKMAITYCGENHTTCVACCNNPQVDACPLCREALEIPIKIMHCQTCTASDFLSPLKFVHCKECGSIGVICHSCSEQPCCRKAILPADTVDKTAIRQHVSTITEKLLSELKEKLAQVEVSSQQRISSLARDAVALSISLDNQTLALKRQIDVLKKYLDKGEKALLVQGSFAPFSSLSYPRSADCEKRIAAYNKSVNTYNQLISQGTALALEAARVQNLYMSKIHDIERERNERLANLRQSHQKLIDILNAMAT